MLRGFGIALLCVAALAPIRVEADARVVVVRQGDVLGTIAKREGVRVTDLKTWNRLDSDMIRVGQKLVIRQPGNASKGKPGGATTGRGWVMVRSNYLTAEHLIRAMKRGDFYASSGVTLNSIEIDDKARTLKLQIKPADGQDFTTHFIGTRKNWNQATEPRGSERLPSEAGQP